MPLAQRKQTTRKQEYNETSTPKIPTSEYVSCIHIVPMPNKMFRASYDSLSSMTEREGGSFGAPVTIQSARLKQKRTCFVNAVVLLRVRSRPLFVARAAADDAVERSNNLHFNVVVSHFFYFPFANTSPVCEHE
jgi:hypothetical protein